MGAPSEAPAEGEAQDYTRLNKANWDERVPVHLASRLYDVEEFLGGADHLHGFEWEELGDLDGRRLVHLQCHFGMDTLSLARRGARVTGVDFSVPAVAAARQLAAEMGFDERAARFVESDVYDAARALGDERFDVVYTGKGALNWIPDLAAWAQVCAELLVPGGFLYLAEYHPLVQMMGEAALVPEWHYFNDGPQVSHDPGDYADPEARLEQATTVEWSHPLSEVVSSVIDAGLQLELFRESDECTYRRFPFMEEHGARDYRVPPSLGLPRLPFMYSLRARLAAPQPADRIAP